MIQFQKSKKSQNLPFFLNQGGTRSQSGITGLCNPGRSILFVRKVFILVDMYPEYYEKRDFEPPLESARARFLAQLDDGEGYQW